MSYQFHWNIVWDNMGYLLNGVWMTLLVTVVSLLCSVVLGLGIGLLRISHRPVVRRLAGLYVEVFRNTPTLVQLIWVYYCLPVLTGVNLDPINSCTLALAINGAAYISEIFRAGIQSVPGGQAEAARSVGMSYAMSMRKIILPQAIRYMIPPFVNESVSLLKYSSLVSVLGVADLTYQAQTLSTMTFRPIEIFTFIGLVYLLLCWAFSACAQVLERRLRASL